jgi:glycosyltransferase involved in cell wall biosynthesis
MRLSVFFSSPDANISGVNTFNANLIRSLVGRGVDARMVVTRQLLPDHCNCDAFHDVPTVHLPSQSFTSYRQSWKKLVRLLSRHAPCIFVPGYDWPYVWRSVTLPASIGIVFTLHSDEEVYYRLGHATGPHANRLVAVSAAIARELAARSPIVGDRIRVIPYGIPTSPVVPQATTDHCRPGRPLRLIYTGRIIQYQKRILDLAYLAGTLHARNVSFHLSIAGGGSTTDEAIFRLVARPWLEKGLISLKGTRPYHELLREYWDYDVFVLPSEFEGLPLSLLEAMQAGCVPVVSAIRSGIPELIDDGANGFTVPIGHVEAFADRIEELYQSPERWRAMSDNARKTVLDNHTLDQTAEAWLNVFEQVQDDLLNSRHVARRKRPERPPAEFRFGMSDFLPEPVRCAAFCCKRFASRFVRKATGNPGRE